MELTRSEYQAIVEFSPNMIWRSGLDANCNYFNETWLKFTGKQMAEEIGAGWLTGVHQEDMAFCIETYLEAFKRQDAFEMEYRLKRHDGQWRWINDRGVPFSDSDGNFAGYIGSCVDVSEKIEGIKLTEMAHTDKLTGIYNRNYLEHIISYEFEKARREQYEVFYMMLDIDRFKLFNDQFGHAFGDKILFMVAQELKKTVRETDTVGRYGGDEFLVVLPKATIAVVQMIAKRILDVIAGIHIDGIDVTTSISIGVAMQSDEATVMEVLKNADEAMYQAKKSGGNRLIFSS